ncbi:hypothetical protein [Streptomyces sp. NPDC051211]|uniref:hypothetical protein n=1 Tax=Streptomyces sp. NPDC051211 TaxID=3154643 RepID=UPI00345087AF
MAIHTVRRRISALGTVLGLGIALPFTVGATPASEAQLDIVKTQVGEFTRGGQGVYRIRVANTGTEATSDLGTRISASAGWSRSTTTSTRTATP